MASTICIYSGEGSLMRDPKAVEILVCLDSVPPNMNEFVNLKTFSINGENAEVEFPDVVYDMDDLQHLHINGRVLIDDDYALVNMSYLKSLTIENFDDPSIRNLYVPELNLEYLCVKNSNLTVKGIIYLRDTLKHLILRNLNMSILSRSVYRLYRLRTLDISENNISVVSRLIMNLINLENFAWSHKTQRNSDLLFPGGARLPYVFYEMLRVDISNNSREDFMTQIYTDEEQPTVEMREDFDIHYEMYNDIDDDEFEYQHTQFDIDEDLMAELDEDEDEDDDDDDDDEGYDSDDSQDSHIPIQQNVHFEERPEFEIDYISRDDKRVPSWEYLYDSDADSDDSGDSDESEYESAEEW